MKSLPPIHGLLRAAELKRQQATRSAKRAMKTSTDPRIAHESGVDADISAREANILDGIAAENADMILQIETIADFIRSAKSPSPLRTLCMRKLESASDHLRREIGDAP